MDAVTALRTAQLALKSTSSEGYYVLAPGENGKLSKTFSGVDISELHACLDDSRVQHVILKVLAPADTLGPGTHITSLITHIGALASVSNKSRGISARTALAAEASSCGISMTWTVQRAGEITADAPRQRWLAEHAHQHDHVASALKLAGGTQGATDRYIMQHGDATPSADASTPDSLPSSAAAAGAGAACGSGGRTSSVSSAHSQATASAGAANGSGRSSPDPSAGPAADLPAASRTLPSSRRAVSSLRLPSAELDVTSDEALLTAFNDLHGTHRMLNWLVAGIDPASAAQRSDRLALRDSGADPLMALVPSSGKRQHSSVFRYTTMDAALPVYIYLRFNRHVPTSLSTPSPTASSQDGVRDRDTKRGARAPPAAASPHKAIADPELTSTELPGAKHRRGQSVSMRRAQADASAASRTGRSHRHSVSMGVSPSDALSKRDATQHEIPWSQYATKGSATATFVLITWNPPTSSNTVMLQHRRAVSKRFPHHVHLTLTGLADLNARSILSRIRNVLNMSSVTLTLEIIPAAALLNPQAIHTSQLPKGAAGAAAPQTVRVKRVQLEIPEGYTLGALRQDISTQLGILVEHQRVFQLRKFTGSSRAEELAESVAHLRASYIPSPESGANTPGLKPSPSELHSAAIHSVLGRDPQPPTTAASLVVELVDAASSIQSAVSGGDTLFIQIVDDSVAHLLPSAADSFSLRQASNVSETAASETQPAGEWGSPPRNRTDSNTSLHVDLPMQVPSMANLHMPASPVAGRVPRVGAVASSLVLSPVASEQSDESPRSLQDSLAISGPSSGPAVVRPSKTSLEVMSAVISRVHAARVAEVREVEEERRSTMMRRHSNLMSTIKKLKGLKLAKASAGDTPAKKSKSFAGPTGAGAGPLERSAELNPATSGGLPGGASALASQLRLKRASLRKITPQNLGDALAEAAGSEDALSHALSSLGDGSSLSQGEADEVASTLSAHVEQLREEVSYLELQMNELKITEPAVGEGATASVYRALWVSPGAIEEVDEGGDAAAAVGSSVTESGARFITDPGVEVALKKFNYVAAQPPPKALKEFKTEVAALRKLPPHPNVVRLIGACTNPGMAIVYEYMPQGTLFHALRSKLTLTLHDRLNLALDCANGLHHLHVNSILHRDIKSHNILLDLHQGRLRAKLGDLGCSRVLAETGDEAMAKTELGTAGYVAPEVLYGVPYAFPADVFSLGVLLYEIFAPAGKDGRVNLPTKDIPIGRYCMEFDKGYRMQWPDVPVDAPEWVLPLVHDCMKADPTARLQPADVVTRLQSHQAAGNDVSNVP